MTQTTDVVVIGAGPVGLFTVFQCGMLKLKCHIIDALTMVGGQCAALYPEKPIYDIPGFPQILAMNLVDQLQEQATPFEPVYHLGEQVVTIKPVGDRFEVTTDKNTMIDTGAVIIAAGVGAFGPNKPPIPGLEEYEQTGAVQYYVKARKDFAGKKIVIAGGGDSALDWILSLQGVAETISVVHRRPKFRGAPDTIDKVHQLADAGLIDLVIPYQLHSLKGSDGKLEAVVVQTLEGAERELPADVLLPFYGLAMNIGPIVDWGLNLEHNHIVINQETSETNIPGIFAVGDIARYNNKLKLILCGFAEAAQAAHTARQRLHPDEVFHFEYSTTQGVPGK